MKEPCGTRDSLTLGRGAIRHSTTAAQRCRYHSIGGCLPPVGRGGASIADPRPSKNRETAGWPKPASRSSPVRAACSKRARKWLRPHEPCPPCWSALV